MFSVNSTNFEKKWVGWAMGNKTIYWDGLCLSGQGFFPSCA